VPEIHLLFTGDINPGRCVYQYAKEANDMALPYRPLADYLQGADITIGSLDAAISDYNPPVPCIETRNLLAPSVVAVGFQWAGFDVITVATNHVKDCGLIRGCDNESFFDTLANLRAAGVQPVGAGHNLAEATAPVIMTVHGVRFAFLGFSAIDRTLWATDTTPGTGPFTSEVYLDAIRRAKTEADVVIVLPHWGTEYSPRINWEQIKSARAMAEAGASLIVGNHPHHVQGAETFPNGAVVAYALGNFVFDQTWSDGTRYIQQGLMLRATFQGARLQSAELIPIHIYDDFQPRLAPADEAAYILQVVADSTEDMPPH
jgi:poly-gamma-glutamate synthesis protein (capsule biosynthesis protein)